MWSRGVFPLLASAVRLLTAAAVALVLAASTSDAQGRRLRITPNKNLSFGTLFPGVSRTVSPTDAVGAAVLDITGPRGNQIEVRFFLPRSLFGPAGSRLPISFTPTSAGFSTGSISTQIAFDPRLPYRPRLSRAGRGTLYLGAVANPGAAQRSGNYSATIIVIVFLTGQ